MLIIINQRIFINGNGTLNVCMLLYRGSYGVQHSAEIKVVCYSAGVIIRWSKSKLCSISFSFQQYCARN